MPETCPTTETVNLNTAISLAPGVNLTVRADLVNDEATAALVEKLKEICDRSAQIDVIRSSLRWLVAGDEYEGLDSVAEMTLWLPNVVDASRSFLARGIMALTATLSDADVIDLASVAKQYADKACENARAAGDGPWRTLLAAFDADEAGLKEVRS